MTGNHDRSLTLATTLMVGCLVAYFAIFLPPALKDSGPPGEAISFDLHSCFLPRFLYGSHELIRGRLPLWNPYEYGGVPFLATAQPAVFYPPKALLFAVFGENTAYWAFMGLHYLALAGGFLLFAREQRIEGAAAFVGASAWTFSLPILLSNYHPTRIANLAFVPLVFLFVERIGGGAGRKRDAAWLVLLLALQLTAGYPEVTLDLGLLVALHATVRFATKQWVLTPLQSIPRFAALWCFAALVAAVQLVPMVEAGLFANRMAVADTTSGPPITLGDSLKSFVPGFFALVLVALPLRRAAPAVAGALVSVTLFQGGWLWLRHLPGFSMVRFPYVWIFMTPFYGAWLAALGVERFLGPSDAGRRFPIVSYVVRGAAFAWAAYCVIAFRRFHAGSAPAGVLATLLGNGSAALLGIVGSLSLVASSIPKVRVKTGRAGVVTALVLLALSQIAGFPFGMPSAPVRRPSEIGIVRRFMPNATRGRALSLDDAVYGYELTDRIPSLFGAEESLVPWRYRQILKEVHYEPAVRKLDWMHLLSAPGFLNAMNVEFIAAPEAGQYLLTWFGYWNVARQGKTLLFRQPRPLGNAWINYSAHFIPDEKAAHDYILGRQFDPSREVVVEEPLERTYPPSSPGPAGLPLSERRDSDVAIEYAVHLPLPGILVSSASFYPGWRVLVDGQPRKLLRVDYVLRGVELPAGVHTVRFEYRPASVRWGIALTLLGVGLLAASFFRTREYTR